MYDPHCDSSIDNDTEDTHLCIEVDVWVRPVDVWAVGEVRHGWWRLSRQCLCQFWCQCCTTTHAIHLINFKPLERYASNPFLVASFPPVLMPIQAPVLHNHDSCMLALHLD